MATRDHVRGSHVLTLDDSRRPGRRRRRPETDATTTRRRATLTRERRSSAPSTSRTSDQDDARRGRTTDETTDDLRHVDRPGRRPDPTTPRRGSTLTLETRPHTPSTSRTSDALDARSADGRTRSTSRTHRPRDSMGRTRRPGPPRTRDQERITVGRSRCAVVAPKLRVCNLMRSGRQVRPTPYCRGSTGQPHAPG